MSTTPTKSVLVVHDNEALSLNIQHMLKNLGYHTPAVANGGARALELTREYCPQLVMVDIDLDGEPDGIATATALRQRHGVPVIFVTDSLDESTVHRARSGQVCGCLATPFTQSELLNLIEIALHRHEAETRLQHDAERLTRVIETSADGILLTDKTGQIVFANAAAEHIFGQTRQSLLTRHYDDVTGGTPIGEDSDTLAQAPPFGHVLANGEAVQGAVHEITHAGGRRIILSIDISPLYDGTNQFTGIAATVTDITERHSLEKQLFHQAFHDTLTGLPNRALFMNRLAKSLARAGRGETDVALMFVDLDNFKLVNDSLGHVIGDQLLAAVSERLVKCLRSADTASRFGGDEFVLLIDELTSTNQALGVAERIQLSMQEPFALASREIYATPSIGIAFSRYGQVSSDDLLRNADAAMYEAKSKGRAGTEVFEEALSARALHRLDAENDLRGALLRHELRLHYQPKIDLVSGRVYGVEALMRWHHPKRGLIAPIDFIGTAEETGLIIPIGQWVLREACAQVRQWQRLMPTLTASTSALGLNVNLSVKQLKHPGLIDEVAQALAATGLEATSLVLELSEVAAMQEGDCMLQVLQGLKALGVRLAIDDFGSGYSSLAYLRTFPFDFIKIDRHFITGMNPTTGDGFIVASMIDLAHSLKLTVVAEGAESTEDAGHLRHMGCDLAQGYYFARPMPAGEMEKFLAEPPVPGPSIAPPVAQSPLTAA